ncbi:type I secretion system permease/ATPase [Sulfitobacter mediterraneus]|uniref:type I secretion system permease/ATPase n=1 Tax=Sulfitobacter mediterraneus TaxID=83219 RepID=UPI00193A018B|nr:type I secretion system permease/ATPase [Sulfitobacter mediterraneus]MBM1555602.1 type I secretion system permease/ATPase [Sulfitobacter mediterraneus]MBM1566845.1 type I secretion system permease/ATPase [Sulfitobacter mediterraneus]MBM1570647.1 type I secretion system permease/ATPase [Sulfitobacter mediterraneus]MBM1574447.1 type I secretion system permease/ATPase [Sulfitobacter mediterraneus]MBM1578560.1 type I secretion system permease/ATPase [Sulfitobacter mediterraneus]
MKSGAIKRGEAELRRVRGRSRSLYLVVVVFSLFANLLLLTGPVFMLQVYDRVLGSGSRETLVALSGLVLFLFCILGLLDHLRGRIMTRIGLRFQADLEKRVLDAVLRKSALLPDDGTRQGLRDLDAVRRLITSPVLIAVFDLPWTPLFFAAIFAFHPVLGMGALAGAVLLVLATIANQILSRDPQAKADLAAQAAEVIESQARAEAETVHALGMADAMFHRWQDARAAAVTNQLAVADIGGGFGVLTRTLRLALQSVMLGLGAWLVLRGQMSGGAMIAGSVLMGRALAPVEALLNHWPVLQQGRKGWCSLAALLGEVGEVPPRIDLPTPAARLSVDALTVVPPGHKGATLKSVSFELEPGQAVGVIGPSASGKSTLARAVMGAWPVAGGQVRLDGATVGQYGPQTLGGYIGYLPQKPTLFDGTIAQNIARLRQDAEDSKVVIAAQKAAAHDMILALPQGYDTVIDAGQVRLSGGQIQRIGLARALYDDPVLLILDEPNANLDNSGSLALNHAVRQMKDNGKAVLIMAHRPAAIQECDMLLVLDGGMRVAFGPKNEVLAGMVKNAGAIQQVPAQAGGLK